MDPVAHTLFGAALAESGLKHRSRHATAALLIGANLPDIDAIAGLWGNDVELHVRRGHTHGILALVLWPLLLTAGIWLWNRWRERRGAAGPDEPPLRMGVILALSILALLSHPLLDWMNTYGVRLLMPFDDRWFYGDTLFIIDPWLWLLAAAGVLLARSATRRAVTLWVVLGAAATGLILSTNLVPLAVKLAWCIGVAALVLLRWQRPAWISSTHLARAGVGTLLMYVGASYGAGRMAEAVLREQFPAAEQVQADPAPGVPFAHRLVVVEPSRYQVTTRDGRHFEVPRQTPDEIVQAALASPSISGFAHWLRFPYWTVEEAADHWVVHIRDLRYQGPDMPESRGIGRADVIVPKGNTQ